MAAHQEKIAYERDIGDVVRAPSEGSSGNIAVFGPDRTIEDGNIKASDIATAETIAQAVASANEGIRNSVISEYALSAYNAAAWSPDASAYGIGDFCAYGGNGYRCISAHVPGSTFDSSKWELVLTADGRLAIDQLLATINISDKASLSDLAPAYSNQETYHVGQLAIKDNALQICTTAGVGRDAVFSSDTTVWAPISQNASAIREINQALDDILNGQGIQPDFPEGLYVEDVDNPGQYHKVVVVSDPESGGYDLAVDGDVVEL